MLRYTGHGDGLANVPARDLKEEELAAVCRRAGITREFLIASGLYVDESGPAATGLSASDESKGGALVD